MLDQRHRRCTKFETALGQRKVHVGKATDLPSRIALYFVKIKKKCLNGDRNSPPHAPSTGSQLFKVKLCVNHSQLPKNHSMKKCAADA